MASADRPRAAHHLPSISEVELDAVMSPGENLALARASYPWVRRGGDSDGLKKIVQVFPGATGDLFDDRAHHAGVRLIVGAQTAQFYDDLARIMKSSRAIGHV